MTTPTPTINISGLVRDKLREYRITSNAFGNVASAPGKAKHFIHCIHHLADVGKKVDEKNAKATVIVTEREIALSVAYSDQFNDEQKEHLELVNKTCGAFRHGHCKMVIADSSVEIKMNLP